MGKRKHNASVEIPISDIPEDMMKKIRKAGSISKLDRRARQELEIWLTKTLETETLVNNDGKQFKLKQKEDGVFEAAEVFQMMIKPEGENVCYGVDLSSKDFPANSKLASLLKEKSIEEFNEEEKDVLGAAVVQLIANQMGISRKDITRGEDE